MIRLGAVLTLAFCLMLSCSQPEPPDFDGERAFALLEKQVAFGPRVPGSESWARCRDWFYRYFDSLGIAVDSQAFTFFDPYSKTTKPLVNVIARVHPNPGEPAVLLAAHYDSRPRTDFHSDSTRRGEPLAGANDGASGVAVLMELAALFADQTPPENVDLVLFDGEDWGRPGDRDYYLLGSKHFASRDIRNSYHFAIVLDLVGDSEQKFPREAYSERYYKPLNDLLWNTAATLGITTFVDSIGEPVIDDHLSLNTGGVPTIVLIDFDYPYWHTENDTPDKCSPQSLSNVGRVVTRVLYDPSLWPDKYIK
jgi:Zn-dependent M28 family amino/carboxypeptidase